MTMGLLSTLRDSRLQIISDAIDAGATGGTLKIYDGVRPATGGAVTTLLATLTFDVTSASTITAGVLTFDTITDDSSADATGTASWARCADSDTTFVCDLSVGATGSGEDIELDSVSIVAGTTVSVTSGTITAGNA